MNALILYDECCLDFVGSNIFEQVQRSIEKMDYKMKSVLLKSQDMKSCTGCFGCWIKTPGYCVFTKDKINEINRDIVQSQIVVYISKIVYGGFSVDLKKYLDRIIPTLLPDFVKVHGETHHKKRYNKYPNIIGIGYGTDISSKEAQTFTKLIERNSLNFYSPASTAIVMTNQLEIEQGIRALETFVSKEVSA